MELCATLKESVGSQNDYLLQNHVPIIGAESLMDASYAMEELEEGAKLAWLLRNENNKTSLQEIFSKM